MMQDWHVQAMHVRTQMAPGATDAVDEPQAPAEGNCSTSKVTCVGHALLAGRVSQANRPQGRPPWRPAIVAPAAAAAAVRSPAPIVYSESTPISMMRSRTGTSNEVGDAERPKSIRKVTRPVSATAPPGRRPLAIIHAAKPRPPSSPISVSVGSGGPTSKTAAATAARDASNEVAQQQDPRGWARPAAGSCVDRKVSEPEQRRGRRAQRAR